MIVSGTITAPQANRSHTEPTNPIDGGVQAAGSSFGIDCGTYANTGNVAQTVTVTPSNVENCTVELAFDRTRENTVILEPGQAAELLANVTANDEPMGSEDVPYSFEVISNWS